MKTRSFLTNFGRKPVIVCGILLLCVAVWIGFVVTATYRQRQSDAELLQRGKTVSKSIQLYFDANKMVPPRVFRDPDPRIRSGTPLYSWRKLVSEFTLLSSPMGWLDGFEEWDSPENADALTNYMAFELQLFDEPRSDLPVQTNFFAVIHPRSFLSDDERVVRYADVTDGLDATLVCIGLKNKHEPWLKPVDVTADEAMALIAQLNDDELVPLVFADGRASLAPPREITMERLLAMTTVDGGEDISDWLKSLKWSD